MSLKDEIAYVRDLLEAAIVPRQREPLEEGVVRFAIYLFARDHLDGRVREIVWTEPPFPEEEDHE